ncbi:D2 protein, partial [Atractosteus spatula]|nr:D2 protein [Atractosteus spatula]
MLVLIVLSLVSCSATFSSNEISIHALLRRIASSADSVDKKADQRETTKFKLFSDEDPKVRTRYGMVKGLKTDRAHVFYGIPYAAPPVRSGRWKPPAALVPWHGVYDATFPRAACFQACGSPIEKDRECPEKVSEDCLYLNIFVPLDVNFTAPVSKSLPVMVWIHGGDFIAGSASKALYDGRFIASSTHTVVVSIAYRLGAFGFLVTGKDPKTSSLGNYGFLDQQTALLWVQQNIAVFGGDPNKVTIFGESAGAQSVSLHLMVQSSKPLFKQAVLQSLPFSIPLKTKSSVISGVYRNSLSAFNDMDCLLSLTPEAVLAAQIKAGSKIVNPFRFLEMFETWGPFIDGELIKEQAVTAFLKGHWQKEKPILLGTTSEEGVIFVYSVFTKPVSLLECTVYTAAIFKQHALRILHKYMPFYPDADHRKLMSQTVTDYVFLCPSRKAARTGMKEGSTVWMYVFDHVISDHRVWDGLKFCYHHACHGAELPFMFNSVSLRNFTFTAQEQVLANQMVCYWGTFAHTGDPNAQVEQTQFCKKQMLPAWPMYTNKSGWLNMNFTLGSHSQHGPRDEFCDFWDKLGIY